MYNFLTTNQQAMHRFKELNVWKKSIDLITFVYQITEQFPKKEIYGLMSQINSSSISIPSNIAEGSAATSKKDFANYLNIARKSLFETVSHLIIAEDQKYINQNEKEELYLIAEELSRKIKSLGKLLLVIILLHVEQVDK